MSRSTATALPFGLTEERKTISAMVRDFADTEIAPHALEWDQRHHFPVDVIKRGADLGMGGIYVREESGGTGMGRMDAALIFEAMSTGRPSVAAYISIHNMVAWMIDKYGNEEQREKYLLPLVSMEHLGGYCLTEPNAGSDAGARARPPGRTVTTSSSTGSSSSSPVPDRPRPTSSWHAPGRRGPAASPRSSSRRAWRD